MIFCYMDCCRHSALCQEYQQLVNLVEATVLCRLARLPYKDLCMPVYIINRGVSISCTHKINIKINLLSIC